MTAYQSTAAPATPSRGFASGIGAAFVAAIVGAIAWAVITDVSNYHIGFVAVGIGFLVGLAIERFGGGDTRLPVAGAVIALIGCVLGDVLADAHLFAAHFHISTFTVLQHGHATWEIYKAGFQAMDALFYAIAAFEGFRFGMRGVARARAAAVRAQQPPAAYQMGTPFGDSPTPYGAPATHVPPPAAPGEPSTAPAAGETS